MVKGELLWFNPILLLPHPHPRTTRTHGELTGVGGVHSEPAWSVTVLPSSSVDS